MPLIPCSPHRILTLHHSWVERYGASLLLMPFLAGATLPAVLVFVRSIP